MKNLILICALFLACMQVRGQDTIVTVKGEVILCKMTSVMPGYISYQAAGQNLTIKSEEVSDKKIHSTPFRGDLLKEEKPVSIEYSEVVKVDSSITKDELFNRARSWFVDYYKDAKEVLQVSDKETGELQGAPLHEFSYLVMMTTYSVPITYRVSVLVKDGRYKVRAYQFYNRQINITGGVSGLEGIGMITQKQIFFGNNWTGPVYKEKHHADLLTQTEVYSKSVFASLKEYMTRPSIKEDW